MTSTNAPGSNHSAHDFSVRRDLLAFIRYVQERGLQRSHRENLIPKTDRKRLLKVLKAPEPLQDTEAECGYWMEWISKLTLRLGLVDYDSEGVYVGYHSQAPSYPDNYIEVITPKLDKYLALSSSEKERRILKALVEHNKNEFYKASLLGTQERFDTWGSADGAASRMPLAEVRMRLLDILSTYPPGEAVPFADFVEHVQLEAPNLIVDHTRKRDQEARKNAPKYLRKRPLDPLYHSLYEFRMRGEPGRLEVAHDTRKEISEGQPDAFMRAEGRYLAYFLEEIPVLMDFVHIQYQDQEPSVSPPLAWFIKSFSVTDKLAGVLGRDSAHFDAVKVTITPDFKIFVEAPIHPDVILDILAPYTTVKSQHRHTTTLELSRAKTVETLTASPAAPSLMKVLTEIAGNVPQNVQADIAEWSSHADKFIVFEDMGLIELKGVSDDEAAAITRHVEDEIVRKVSKKFHLLHNPGKAYEKLERAELIPSHDKHPANGLHGSLLNASPAKKSRQGKKAEARDSLKKVLLVESGLLGFTCDDLDFLRSLESHLRESGVAPVLFEEAAAMLAAPDDARTKINAFLKKMRVKFNIEIQ